MPPLLFISSRFILAGILLSMVGFRQIKSLNWHQYKQAIVVGSIFAAGMCFWIMGLYSGVNLSVGGFLTSLAVVISPALARIFFKEPAPFTTWLSMPVVAIGLGFLSLNSGIEIETGQLLFITASFFFALFFIPEYTRKAYQAAVTEWLLWSSNQSGQHYWRPLGLAKGYPVMS